MASQWLISGLHYTWTTCVCFVFSWRKLLCTSFTPFDSPCFISFISGLMLLLPSYSSVFISLGTSMLLLIFFKFHLCRFSWKSFLLLPYFFIFKLIKFSSPLPQDKGIFHGIHDLYSLLNKVLSCNRWSSFSYSLFFISTISWNSSSCLYPISSITPFFFSYRVNYFSFISKGRWCL